MTKRDFELIAQSVRVARPGLRSEHTGPMHFALDHFSILIANALANDNPRFDRERFLKACGVA
jgi:hypothetical protein